MKQDGRKIKDVLKVIFICSAILFTSLISFTSSEGELRSSDFNLQSATLISLGFGVSLGMVKQNFRKA